MKTKFISILLFGSFFIFGYSYSSYASSVFISGKNFENQILLRWSVEDPELWEIAKKRGFILERFTFESSVKDTQSLYFPKKQLVRIPPISLMDTSIWLEKIRENDYAALFAQTLYGEKMQMNLYTNGYWQESMQLIEDERLRFGMAMLALDRDFSLACFTGMGYRDTNIHPGVSYLYRIYIDSTESLSDTALFYTKSSPWQLKNPLQALHSRPGDAYVELRWSTQYLYDKCVAYHVYKSYDKKKWIVCNQVPISQTFDEEGSARDLIYTDTFLQNEKNMYYQIYGQDIFGEISAVTEVVKTAGLAHNIASPIILSVEEITAFSLQLNWDFPDLENEKIEKFHLYCRSSIESDDIVLDTNMKKNIRSKKLLSKDLFPSNYFTIEAIGRDGLSIRSERFFYIFADTIAPTLPTALSYISDSSGQIHLSWKSPLDSDLLGFRVFRANRKEQEYVQLTSDPCIEPYFFDTLSLTTNKSVFYCVSSVDKRGNMSDFSLPLEVKRPVRLPMESPLFSVCQARKEKLFLSWYNSQDEDIIAHILYVRKNNQAWEEVYRGKAGEADSTLFSMDKEDAFYEYKIAALSSFGDTAFCPKNYIFSHLISPKAPRIEGFVYRDKKCIALQWTDINQDKVKRYHIYRKQGDDSYRLLGIVEGENDLYIDTQVKMNTRYSYVLRVEGLNGEWSDYSSAWELNY